MSIPSNTTLESQIAALTIAPNTVACVWLGQGGYLFKSPGGVTVVIDPYLSEYAEAFWGVRRAIPAAIDQERFSPDVYLVTHWHEDHLDAPTIRHYACQPGVAFAGPESCVVKARVWGWPAERTVILEQGDSHQFGDIAVTATFARHHVPIAPAPDAVGFLLDIGGLRLWNVGDSEYDARLRAMASAGIDVMFVPINGVGGNMNAHEAALLAWQVAPRIAVPMHYGMWPAEGYGEGATLDPAIFRDTLARLGGETEARVLQVGEIVLFT